MTKTSSFKIIHNLDKLSEADQQQYLRDASEFLGLPPDLNALDLIWMNSEDGMRRLVAYARRGTTDILRATHGIEVTNLQQITVPGTVSFQAIGKNAAGRQEHAIGSCGIEGLRGERLAVAVMTAQTRALRRLTLSFVGGGLLDETEVNSPVTDIAAAAASGALLVGTPVVFPPPQAAPNIAPGRDITPGEPAVQNPPAEGVSLQETSAVPHGAGAGAWSGTGGPEPKKKRTYKKRNTVDLASPAAAQQTEIPPGMIDAGGNITPISVPPATVKQEQEAIGNGVASAPALAEVSELIITADPAMATGLKADTPTVVQSAPPQAAAISPVTAEKAKEYRERLGKYSQDILPKAGMMPSEGVGGVTMKLRKFAGVFSGTVNTQALNEEQWNDLLEFLDGYSQKNGAAALVTYINQAIGVS
jgi:hypothetical protein